MAKKRRETLHELRRDVLTVSRADIYAVLLQVHVCGMEPSGKWKG